MKLAADWIFKSVFCCFSVTKLCLTLCNPVNCSTPGFLVLHYLPEFAQTHVHWIADAIQPSPPLSTPSPLALNLSQHQGLFQWVGSLHQVAKVFNFHISPSNEYSGLISFRIDWFDLLAVQGTLKSILQHYISKALIFQGSAFFMVQLSHPHMTSGKTIALMDFKILILSCKDSVQSCSGLSGFSPYPCYLCDRHYLGLLQKLLFL